MPSRRILIAVLLFGSSNAFGSPPALSLDLPAGARPIAIEVGAQGDVYLAGPIWSTNPNLGIVDSFVARYNPRAAKLVYLTKFGTPVSFTQNGLALDAAGAAYLTGDALAVFPVTIPPANSTPPSTAFPSPLVVKLTPTGQVAYSRLVNFGHGAGIAVNAAGEAYITGSTYAPTMDQELLATPGAAVNRLIPNTSFVMELDASGGSILLVERGIGGEAIALDAQQNIYVAGAYGVYPAPDASSPPVTPSGIPSSFSGTCSVSFFGGSGGCIHQHIAKLDPTGSTLLYGVFVTSNSGSRPSSIAADAQGDLYFTGFTSGPNYPVTAGAVETAYPSGSAASQAAAPHLTILTKPPEVGFVSELNPDGTGLIFSTYLASLTPAPSGINSLNTVQKDSVTKLRLYNNQIYVAGHTVSSGFPGLSDFPARCLPAAFLMRVAADGSSVDQVHSATLPTLNSTKGGPLSSSFAFDAQGFVYQVSPTGSIVTLDPSIPDVPSSCATDSTTFQLTGAIAPGQVISVFGNGLGNSEEAASMSPGLLPSTLGNTSADFDGIPARLLYASASQVNLMVPYEIAGRPQTTMHIKTSNGGSNTLRGSNVFDLAARMPSAFLRDIDSPICGTGTITLVRLADGSLNDCTNSAPGGSVVSIYLDGGGLPGFVPTSGQIADQATKVNVPVVLQPYLENSSIAISGPPEVVNLSLDPGSVSGIWRLDVRVPTSAIPIEIEFIVVLDGVPMQNWVGIYIKP